MPDVRLIDANALPNFECKVTATVGDQKGPAEMRFVFWQDIEKAPTIDAVPAVHGWWNTHTYSNRVDTYGNPDVCAECSNCGFRWYSVRDANCFHYCPDCGAKMDGGAADV